MPPAAAAAPAAGAAAKGAASVGATIASSVLPIAMNTLVGGMMGGEKGALGGMLGGLLSAGTQQIMGGMFNNKGASAGAGATAGDVAKGAGNLGVSPDSAPKAIDSAMPSLSTPRLDAASMGANYSLNAPKPSSAITDFMSSPPSAGQSELSPSLPTPTPRTPAPSNQAMASQTAPLSGGVRAPGSTEAVPQPGADPMDRYLQAMRQMEEERYNRNMRTNMISTPARGLMSGVSNYFAAKADETPDAIHPESMTDMAAAQARGKARAVQKAKRRQALRGSIYPKLGRY